MDSVRWEQIQTVFHQAAELPREDWQVFLKSACGDDSALRASVLAMLEADSGDTLLDRGVSHAALQLMDGSPHLQLPGKEIGPYRIRKLIGEGGMGVVYLAQRADVDSLVALKLLRDAWLSPARRDRFLAEQRTLAQLNHPAIARFYDADTLADGTPFFVMEYVEGQPLTEYCWQHQLSIAERLNLFRSVCEAVQHAHGLAIIHRDLKPSNILVNSDRAVKLLDFGIAKHLDSLGQPADHTLTGLRLMTLAYAAPEQIRGDGVGIYTDVYSLGVILYELLTGCLPFDLSRRTPGEAERVIVESDPEKPSERARGLAGEGANKRSWAELDVLCLTAMHKDPARRYASVEALIRDLNHYLKGQPLEAQPDSVRYRLSKFVGRNRRAVTAATAVFVIVAGLIIFFTIRLAAARNAALGQAALAQRIQRFMLNLFDGGDPSAAPADSLLALTLVDRGVQTARALDREPAVQAELYQSLGNIYQKLGKLERADSLLKLALERHTAIFGRENRHVAESLVALGTLRIDQARLDEAERLVRQGLAMSRKVMAPSDPALARAEVALGRIQQQRGDYRQATATLEEAVRLQSGPNGSLPDLATALSELANTQFYAGNYALSESTNRRVLALHEQLYGERHPMIADDLINLAAIQTNLGHYREAEAFDRRALDINRSWYGKDHPETGASMNYLGQALVMQGRYPEAEELLRQSLAIQERVYGPLHQRVAVALNELGLLAVKRGKLDEAEALFRRAVDIDRAVYGDRHQSVAIESANLATVFLEKKEYVRAERLFREVIERYKQTLPPDHLNIGIAEIKLGRTLVRQRHYQEAEAQLLAGYGIVRKRASVSWMQTASQDLVHLYDESGHPQKADQYRTRSASR